MKLSYYALLFMMLWIGLSSISYTNTTRLDNTAIEIIAPLEFNYYNEATWTHIEKELVSGHHKTITIDWQGFGGYVNIGLKFIRALTFAQSHGKIVIFNLVGDSYSEHAIVMCYAQNVKFHKHAGLFFHAMKSGDDTYTKGGYWGGVQDREYAKCEEAGFLTKSLVQRIVKDHKMVVIRPNAAPKIIEDM